MFSPTGNNSQTRHFAVLSVVMLGVLLASVGAAWLVVRGGHRNSTNGAKIIGEIRQKGLSAYWPREEQLQWYIIRKKGRTQGWVGRLRWPARDKWAFEGLDVTFYPAVFGVGMANCENWRLDEKATSGAYQAFIVTQMGKSDVNTRIILDDGRVLLDQAGQIHSEAPTPENYVPEGALDLAYFLAARKGISAQFAFVINNRPPKGATTQFSNVIVRDAVAIDTGWRVTVRGLDDLLIKRVLYFDAKGTLTKQLDADEKEEIAVTAEQMAEVFPGAMELLRGIRNITPDSEAETATTQPSAETTPAGD